MDLDDVETLTIKAKSDHYEFDVVNVKTIDLPKQGDLFFL